MKTKVAIYCRVAREERQEEQPLSLEEQKEVADRLYREMFGKSPEQPDDISEEIDNGQAGPIIGM